MSLKKKIDLILLLFWPIVVILASFKFSINAFLSPFIFYGIPSIFLSLRIPKFIKRGLIFSLFSIPFMTAVDYVAELTGIWLWPLPHSIFSYKIFNVVSFEVLIWAFLHFYVVVFFYEYFLDRHLRPRHTKLGGLIAFTAIASILFLFLISFYPTFLRAIPYWYAIFGGIIMLPCVLFEGFAFPQTYKKILKSSAYFLYLNFVYEITALKIGWWSFPSKQFLGYVTFFGVTFPFEEFFFWIILFTIFLLSCYEYFFDDEK